MKCIFEASSGLEAHMISNLLQQVGITSRIDGEFLQGGVGELQAMGFVRVLVEDADYTNAQEVIKTWDTNQLESAQKYTHKSKSSGVGIGLIIGLLIGAGATFLVYNTPVTIEGIDYNDDGKLDEKWVYRDNRISRIEIDRNLDGSVDNVHLYNRKGRIYKTETDDNFDGVFEGVLTYKRGNPDIQTIDSDQDGIVDIKSYSNFGVLREIDIIGPTPTSPKKKQYFEMHKLISSEFDSNGDGIYDKKYSYDYYEQIK
jgi:hypothetical protein